MPITSELVYSKHQWAKPVAAMFQITGIFLCVADRFEMGPLLVFGLNICLASTTISWLRAKAEAAAWKTMIQEQLASVVAQALARQENSHLVSIPKPSEVLERAAKDATE